MTHDVPRMGSLIWISEATFDEQPTIEDAQGITNWRWPVFFPLSVAIHRKIVTPLGLAQIPAELKPFPLLRSGNKKIGWQLVELPNGSLPSRSLGPTKDPSIPIYRVVNDTRLKEMIVSGWRPEDNW